MITANNASYSWQIKNLAIVLAALFLYEQFKDWELMKIMWTHREGWDGSTTLFLLPKIILPIGLWGLWSLRRYGWVLTTTVVVYFMTSVLVSTLFAIKWQLNEAPITMSQTPGRLSVRPIDSSMLNQAFGFRPVIFYVAQLVVIGSILFFLNKRAVIDLLQISRKTQWTVLGLTTVPLVVYGIILLV